MANYLGTGLATIVTGLAPQVVVVIGEVTRAWDRVGPLIAEVLQRRVPALIQPRVIPTDYEAQPRLRGAVTLVIQKHFGVPNVA
jgi:predicted NBD/HSP70 family sugar kinase